MYLETNRMIIRNFIPEDITDLHDILGDDKTMEHCEPAYSLEKTNAFLNHFCIERRGAVAAVQKESGKMIGYILFHEFDTGVYEIGWFFNRLYWRQGYAFESCKAVIDYAFNKLNAHRIFAEAVDAVKSVNLMKKLDMQLQCVQQTEDNDGNRADLYCYELLDQNWRRLNCEKY